MKEPNPFWAAYDPYGYNNPSEKDKPYKIKKDNEKKTLCIGGIQLVKNDSPNDYKEDFPAFKPVGLHKRECFRTIFL